MKEKKQEKIIQIKRKTHPFDRAETKKTFRFLSKNHSEMFSFVHYLRMDVIFCG